ncbi:MAG: hypothetical protein E7381_02750 [Clostridiales bacterium]|nr:hypothetical protein [Clostridiales bacterium]
MRKLFFKLFSDTPFIDGAIVIESFNIWHFLYLFIIIGLMIGGAFFLKNKCSETKEKVLRFLVYALVLSYISDWFVHDFVYSDDGVTGSGLNMDKLPFHICTVLCPIIAFTQFNKRFKPIIEPVTALAIVAPLMYITYPSTGVGGEPWCYRTLQTMFFHGVELAWGFLSLTTGTVQFKWKKIWKSLVMLAGVAVWAKLGNLLLGYNWFFIEKDPFGIGLSPYILPFAVVSAIFAMVALIYAIYFGAKRLLTKQYAPLLVANELAVSDEAIHEDMQK